MQKPSITNGIPHSQNPVERAEFDLKNESSLWPILKFFMGLLKIVQAKNDDSRRAGGTHRVHFSITLRVSEKWLPKK